MDSGFRVAFEFTKDDVNLFNSPEYVSWDAFTILAETDENGEKTEVEVPAELVVCGDSLGEDVKAGWARLMIDENGYCLKDQNFTL